MGGQPTISLRRSTLGSNEKVTSGLQDFALVFFDLRDFFEVSLYKSTLKSAIIRNTKVVCLHGKQTTGKI